MVLKTAKMNLLMLALSSNAAEIQINVVLLNHWLYFFLLTASFYKKLGPFKNQNNKKIIDNSQHSRE